MATPFEFNGYYPVYDNIAAAKSASTDGTIFIVRDSANNRDLYVALTQSGDVKLNLQTAHIQNECKDMTQTRINSYNETIINEDGVGNVETTTNNTTYTVYHHTGA